MMAASGVTLVDLLYDRYYNTDYENTAAVNIVMTTTNKRMFRIPPVLCLVAKNITAIGDTDALMGIVNHVQELDVGDNKLSDWSEVLTLLECMPHLEFLNISENLLQNFDVVNARATNPDKPLAVRLSKLVLNSLSLSWQKVWTILQITSNVEELYLSKNGLGCIEPPPEGRVYPSVKDLYLSANKLSNHKDLMLLGQTFPNLHHLVMIRNPVTSLCSGEDLCVKAFPHVRRLNLTGSAINTWTELETLRFWPELTDLRIRSIPLSQSTDEETFRKLALCYLPTIQTLNGSQITASERENAERFFVRYYSAQENKPQRYTELHEVLGDLKPLVEVDLQPQTVVTVALFHNEKSQLLTLPVNWTVHQLKNHLSDIVGLTPKQMELYLRDHGMPFGDERMVYNTRTLLRYSVKDGFHIYVETKK